MLGRKQVGSVVVAVGGCDFYSGVLLIVRSRLPTQRLATIARAERRQFEFSNG